MTTEEVKDGKMKKIAGLRTLLEERVTKMERELEQWQALLDFVNTALLKEGFKKAEIVKPPPTPTTPQPAEEIAPSEAPAIQPPVLEDAQAIPLKTVTGDLLANLYVTEDSMRVVLAEDKQFDINTPPFRTFLLERVLAKMQEKDQEAVNEGKISSDKILTYNIDREGDVLHEITIRNIESDRSRELKSTIKWTLEKMYEKTKTTAE
ncbi:MAG: hypothetical protein PVF15_06000 [Candidatus Bathyarchaeota archaeon]